MKRRSNRRANTPVRRANVKRKATTPPARFSILKTAGLRHGALLILLTLAAVITFYSSSDSSDPSDRTERPPPRRAARATPDFWASAQVPDPGADVPPTVIRPEDLGVLASTTPIDHPTRITQAILEDDLPALQSAALSWFEQDPTAARDWLAMQSTYEDLQPAISYIAANISERGDLPTAVEWTHLLPEGTLRENTLFDMHALALRNGQITASEIPLDLIPPDRREDLLSGAAGD